MAGSTSRMRQPWWSDGNRNDSQDTEARILAAAERVFAEKGLKGARTAEIAALARVTPSLINYHYRGKENLYKTVIENYYSNVQRRLFPIMMKDDIAPQEKLRKLIEIGIDMLAENDHVARILLRESIDKGKYVNEVLSKPYLREMFELSERFVFSNMKGNRHSRNDTIHLISNIFGCMTMFFIASSTIREFWKKDVYARKMIEERKEEVVDFVFNGIGSRFR
ncbi:MAG: TetR/AcrR family transcriptional regulator [bacterium]